ncbi:MAG: TorF family putative porin [Bacteroidales bacterium]
MRKQNFLLVCVMALLMTPLSGVFAQEDEGSSSEFSVGADVVSSYVWRGTLFSGSAFQPSIEFSSGGFSLGAWGSFDFVGSFAEADLYAAYAFDFGLSIGITDYYYPGTPYLEFSDTIGAHALELNLGYEISGFSIGANYIFNEAKISDEGLGAGSAGGDMYFELGYGFKDLEIFVGAGDGWHSSDGEFALVNIGVASSKEIPISDTYSLPVGVAAIWNPDKEQFYIVGTISF